MYSGEIARRIGNSITINISESEYDFLIKKIETNCCEHNIKGEVDSESKGHPEHGIEQQMRLKFNGHDLEITNLNARICTGSYPIRITVKLQ